MSRENVEIVRRIYERFNAGENFDDELIDPEIEYVNPPEAIEPGTRRGREAYEGAIQSVRDAYGEIRIVVDRIEERDDRVAVASTWHIQTPSGMQTAGERGALWTLRNDRAVRVAWFNECGQAFELLHRPEPSPHDASPSG